MAVRMSFIGTAISFIAFVIAVALIPTITGFISQVLPDYAIWIGAVFIAFILSFYLLPKLLGEIYVRANQ